MVMEDMMTDEARARWTKRSKVSLDWRGAEVLTKVEQAAADAINEIMADCVVSAKADFEALKQEQAQEPKESEDCGGCGECEACCDDLRSLLLQLPATVSITRLDYFTVSQEEGFILTACSLCDTEEWWKTTKEPTIGQLAQWALTHEHVN